MQKSAKKCIFWKFPDDFLQNFANFDNFWQNLVIFRGKFRRFFDHFWRDIAVKLEKMQKISEKFFFFSEIFFFYFFKISFYSRKSYKKFLFFVTFFLKNFWKISKKNFFAFFCKSCYSPEFVKWRNFEKKIFRKIFAFFFIPKFLQFFWKFS